MPDRERRTPTAESGGGLYLAVGAVVAAALVGAYVMIGAPGLHQPVAKAPADVAQQPAATAR
jgi:hypothetical protein